MNEQIKEIIKNLISLLTEEQKQKDIIELNETMDIEVVKFLTKIGAISYNYKIEHVSNEPNISEQSGNVNLWYKDINGTWIVKMDHLNRLIKKFEL